MNDLNNDCWVRAAKFLCNADALALFSTCKRLLAVAQKELEKRRILQVRACICRGMSNLCDDSWIRRAELDWEGYGVDFAKAHSDIMEDLSDDAVIRRIIINDEYHHITTAKSGYTVLFQWMLEAWFLSLHA